MDFTELRQKLYDLIQEHLGQAEPAIGPAEAARRLVDSRNAVDDIYDVLEELDGKAAKLLAEHGIDTKRCTKCSHWMVVAGQGRPRQYCSDRCRAEARQARS